MSRDITAAVSTAIEAAEIAPFFAVDLALDDTPLYLWTGYGDLTIGAKTYLGAGQLLTISTVEETTEMQATGASLTLSGIPSSFLAAALTQPYQGRECRIYFGVTGSPSDYVEVFAGELDQMNIMEGGDAATIQVTAENVLVRLERPVVRRFTHEDQKSRYPSDLGLEFVAGLQDREIFWGRVAK